MVAAMKSSLPRPGLLEMARLGVRSVSHGHEVADELHRRHGDVVRFGAGRMMYVFLFGREANELVLGEGHDAFLWGPALQALAVIDGPSALVLSDGDDHKRRRRMVQPAFATRRVDAAVPVVVEEVDRVIDGLRVGETVDLYEAYRAAVRRIVTRVLFGDALGDRSDELGEALEPALHFLGRPPQLQVRGTPASIRARRARKAADVIVDAEVARRRASGDLGTDVLGMLLATELSDEELRDQVVSLIAAGYDTTSGAVAFAVLELLRTEGEWERVQAEVVDRLGDRAPTADDLRAMPYVSAAVNETLRLWPAPFSGRVTTEAITYAGHEIPAGSTIVFSPYVTQRSTEYWGDDADAFRPSRWLDGAEHLPYTYIPFGGAYRRCIGFFLALTELQTVVARLVQRTSLRLADPGRVERGTGIAAMRPEHGLRVVVESVDVRSGRESQSQDV
jgi:cytochrome P450